MIRKWLMLGVLMTALSTATYALAEDVYATKNGQKYHKEICEFIKDRKPFKIDKEQAIKKGLKPCRACYEDKTGEKKEHK